MINLLPDEHKREIRAGRTNLLLIRYISMLLVAAVVLGGLLAGAYIVLNTTKTSAEQKVQDNQKLVADFQSVRTQADSFRSDLSTAKTILDQQLSYSKLIYKIADIVPKNVVLDDLTLDPKSFGSNGTMNASAKTFDDATKLKDALIRNSEIFSNVQLQTLRTSASDSATDDTKYPVKVILTVVINKGALE